MEGEQVRAYADADFSLSHQSIIDTLSQVLGTKHIPESIVDLGCGPGDMTSRLLTLFPQAKLLAIDGSVSMIQYNQSFLEKRNQTKHVSFLCSCIQDWIPYTSYDLIFSNSLLHHLQDPFVLWSAIQRAMGENSFIFVCDLIRPESFSQCEVLVNRHAKDASDILKNDFLNSLMASFTIEEVAKQLDCVRLANRMKLVQISDRHWMAHSLI